MNKYSIAKAKESISNGIDAYLKKDENGKYILDEVSCLPFFIEGAPGIGKTQIVEQIANEKELGYVSFSLVHHTRNSLLGMPAIYEFDNGDKYTKYTMSEVIAAVYECIKDGHDEGILLLDEFPCMSESVMPAMLAFLQTKAIGGHSLPRGWVLVLCGNPIKYNKSAHSFDAAVTDRIRKIEVEYDLSDFLEYAKVRELSPYIISYLEQNPEHMYRFSNVKGNEELVTCRGWENLSHALKLAELLDQYVDEGFIEQFVKSEVVASTFAEYYKQQCCGMTEAERQKILDGKNVDPLVKKYQSVNFEKKWNVAAYLMTYVKSLGTTMEDFETVLKYGETIIDYIAPLIKQNAMQWNDSTFLSDLDTMERATMLTRVRNTGLIPDSIKDFDGRIMLKLLEGWQKKLSELTLHAYEDNNSIILKALSQWRKEYKSAIEREQNKLSSQIDNLFKFLGEIEDGDTLMERLYIEISNNPILLKNVCAANSKLYIEMCMKQYGIQGVS